MIEYGAAFYSSNVFRTVAISPTSPSQIISIMDSYDAGGSTNTAAAVNSSRNILNAAENTGRYILLVSDGEPCCGGGAMSSALNAAAASWNQDMTIFTLEIRRSNSSGAMSNFMTDMAGTPENRGDPNYHFVATSANDLVEKFRQIVASILCKVGPLDPVPVNPDTIRVFLADGTNERRLPSAAEFSCSDMGGFATTTDCIFYENRSQELFAYESSDQTIRVTSAACDAILDDDDDLIIRYDRPLLTE